MSVVYLLFVFWLLSGLSFHKYNQGLNLDMSKVNKGISAILIVIGHCVSAIGYEEVKFLNVGWYCVAIFFFWSGYGVTYGYECKEDYLRRFWKVRLTKVLVPFLVAHIIYWMIKSCCGIKFSFKDILLGVGGQCTIVDNSWYPIAILVFYALFYWCFKNIQGKNKRILVLFCVTIFISFIMWWVLGKTKDYWFISNLAFWLGVWICSYDRNLEMWKTYILVGIGGYVVAMASVPIYHMIFNKYSYSLYILSCNFMSTCIVLLLVVMIGKMGKSIRFMSFLGKISYEIYLIHGLIIWSLQRYATSINLFLFCCIVCMISILCALILYRVDEIIITVF